jgi:hypothetical protein
MTRTSSGRPSTGEWARSPPRVKSTPLGKPVKQPGIAQRMTRTSSGREGPNTGGGVRIAAGVLGCRARTRHSGQRYNPHGCRLNLPPSAPEHTRTSQLGGTLGRPADRYQVGEMPPEVGAPGRGMPLAFCCFLRRVVLFSWGQWGQTAKTCVSRCHH